MNMDYLRTIGQSLGALAFHTLAIITSLQSDVEWWLRITSLVVSIVVGILTIIWIAKKLSRLGEAGDKSE